MNMKTIIVQICKCPVSRNVSRSLSVHRTLSQKFKKIRVNQFRTFMIVKAFSMAVVQRMFLDKPYYQELKFMEV